MNLSKLILFCFISLIFSNAFSQSLLWEITGKNLSKPSYLYGTVHIKDKRAFEFNDSVFVKLNACDQFAMELIETPELMAAIEKEIMLPEGETLDQLFTKKELEKVNEAFKASTGIDVSVVNSMKPIAVMMMIMEIKEQHDMDMIVDDYLYEYALKNNIPTKSLEGLEAQLPLFEFYTPKVVMKYINDLDKADAWMESMIQAYQKADLKKLDELQWSDETHFSMLEEILIKRNYSMQDSMEVFMKEGATFFAVGAGHLPGKEGLIQLLKNDGYQVEPIIAKHTQTTISLNDWYLLEDKEDNYSVEFPGKSESRKEKTAQGMEFVMHGYEPEESAYDDNYFYAATCIPLAEEPTEWNEEFVEDLLAKSQASVIDRVQGNLLNTRRLNLNGTQGIEYEVGFLEGAARIKVRQYLANEKMYMIQVISMKMTPNNANMNRFLDSFKFLK